MKPTTPLVNALRKAADRIANSKPLPDEGSVYDVLNPDYYYWGNPCTCNCGILAQELGMPAMQIRASGIVLWSETAQKHFVCATTGHRMQDVFAYLSQFGLEQDDFKRLEFLGLLADPDSEDQGDFENPYHVARYFRAQADILEEALGNDFEDRPLTLTPAKEQVSV